MPLSSFVSVWQDRQVHICLAVSGQTSLLSTMPPKPKSQAKAAASHSDGALSASPHSAASPRQAAPRESAALASLPHIEVKPQKACVLCRRSKVKCIHDGAPPCKRCKDTNQEAQCKFRLRADDESWRERTDDVLSRLGESVEWLVQQQQRQQQQQQSQQQSQQQLQHVSHDDHRRSDAIGSTSSPMSAPSPRKAQAHAPMYRPPPTSMRPANILQSRASADTPDPSDPLLHHNPAGFHNRPSSTTYLGFDGAAGLLSPGDSHPRSVSSPSSSNFGPTNRAYRSPPASAQSFRPLRNPYPPSPPLPAANHGSLSFYPGSTSIHSSSAGRFGPDPSSSTPRSKRSNVRQAHHAPTLEPGQTRPSSLIYAAHSYEHAAEPRQHPASAHQPAFDSPYATPTNRIGRNDPRLTVISMGLVSMGHARHLFKFFARYLQPHCFGFPAYPANEHMTPLIIACILMVSAMHEPNSRKLFERLRHEAFSSPLLLDQPIDRSAPLDPELGIGVEEITGACIAACWLGGQTALSVARLARYWAIGYLEHFEVRSAQTLGEWMTILPPFRQIDLVGKLRIWLMSYITEAQQAVINDTPSLFPVSDPAHYCQGLLNASSHSVEIAESLAKNEGSAEPNQPLKGSIGTPNSSHFYSAAAPAAYNDGAGGMSSLASDRQLVAHARMMSILLAAQDLHRSARSAAASTDEPSRGSNGPASQPDAAPNHASQMVERWREWLEELNRWRLLTSQHSDLSDSSLESVDLSLLYHLSRTFLASHPLDPDVGILDETQHALKAASNSNPPNFSRLAVAQLRTISTAKHSALFALKLATTEFGEKLSYLPQFYHWLLGHAAGLLLMLVQRRETFLMAKEADSLLEVTEKFVQLYVFRITSHSFHSAVGDNGVEQSFHRGGIKRSASGADLRGDDPDSRGDGQHDSTRARHNNPGNDAGSVQDGASDPLNFQWPFMSGFPTSASAASAATGSIPTASPNPILQQQFTHGNPAEKHPAIANAQALSRALYLVKMQVQSLNVRI